ncbi:DNA cytosine methyltransferase [Bradyrhizobium sp. 170]|nr:DNA cytosine methyltransferase [Bradyrhizobium sp. 170]
MTAWYNEIDAYAAGWLRNLISERLIADGEVDTRSIVDVRADELAGFDQLHFFAGIGGWSLALRRAGWPDARPVWTGSCPCQPFSLLGKQAGYADPRHLWPTWARLIRERRPATVFGEQLATAPRWLRLVRGDLEALGYAVGALPVEAACAGAEQLRDRYWFVAHRDIERGESAGAWLRRGGSASEARHDAGGRGVLVNGIEPGLERHAGHVDQAREESQAARSAAEAGLQFGSGAVANSAGLGGGTGLRQGLTIIDGDGAASDSRAFDLAICLIDGKVRRVKPGLHLVADGIPARVDKLRALGNAIDPRPAAAFIRAAMQCIGAGP